MTVRETLNEVVIRAMSGKFHAFEAAKLEQALQTLSTDYTWQKGLGTINYLITIFRCIRGDSMYQLALLVDDVVVKLFLMNKAKYTIGRSTDNDI